MLVGFETLLILLYVNVAKKKETESKVSDHFLWHATTQNAYSFEQHSILLVYGFDKY